MAAAALLVLPCGMAKPWDARRFASTTFFFNSPDQVLRRTFGSPFAQPTKLSNGDILWSAKAPLLEWGPLDDVVMGGVSQSSFEVAGDIGKFSGMVSTDNNGGFAGVRSKALTPPLKLKKFSGLKLRIRGDDRLRRYKFIVRDSYAWNGIAWSQSFDATPADAAGGWQDVELPFDGFTPTLFAKRVPGVSLNTDEINTLQITYSKFEYDSELSPNFAEGAFALSVESVSVMI